MVMQCPKCELRFDLKPMLADHLRTDHGMSPEATGHLEPPASRVGLGALPPRPEPTGAEEGRASGTAPAQAEG